ncbi:MAG TPA: hypothetical protein VLH86_05840, partial [Patescibacteria group bacterium]|nr:hypothetical protein [Patescibacteria group bacterium]
MAYVPVRSRLGWQIAHGADVNGLVVATHQPFREENVGGVALKAARRLPNPVAAGFEFALNMDMPRMAHGDRLAAAAQYGLRPENRGPHVVHPYGQEIGDRLANGRGRHQLHPRPNYHALAATGPFTELQWQFTIEHAKNNGTYSQRNPERTAEDTVAAAQEQGLGRVAADANHLLAVRQGDQFSVEEAEAIVGWLARNKQLGVFEFGLQPNLGGDVHDLNAILSGDIADTGHGRLLAVAAQNTSPDEDFTIKVEIPASAFEAKPEQGGLGLDYQLGHQRLIPIIGEHAVNNLAA